MSGTISIVTILTTSRSSTHAAFGITPTTVNESHTPFSLPPECLAARLPAELDHIQAGCECRVGRELQRDVQESWPPFTSIARTRHWTSGPFLKADCNFQRDSRVAINNSDSEWRATPCTRAVSVTPKPSGAKQLSRTLLPGLGGSIVGMLNGFR